MIKFTEVPICLKCGFTNFTWALYSKGMLDNTDTPKEFLVLKCMRCNGKLDMYTKDYVIEGSQEE